MGWAGNVNLRTKPTQQNMWEYDDQPLIAPSREQLPISAVHRSQVDWPATQLPPLD